MSSASPPHTTWTIGQKIICIDDAFPRSIADWCDALPFAGEVYTIRAMQLGWEPATRLRDIGFLLVEVISPRKASGGEAGFFHTRFVAWRGAEAVSCSASEPLELPCAP